MTVERDVMSFGEDTETHRLAKSARAAAETANRFAVNANMPTAETFTAPAGEYVEELPQHYQQPAQRVQEVSASNATWYSVALPSKGRHGYPEVIEYRDILGKDEKIIASATSETMKSCIDSVMRSLLRDPSLYNHLSLNDRDFLTIWIWSTNYSPVKTAEVHCPYCGEKESHKVDMRELDIKDLEERYRAPFPLKLSSGDVIHVRLNTVMDENIAEDFIRKHPKLKVDMADALLALSIMTDKKMTMAARLQSLEEMRGYDKAMLRAFHKHFRYGPPDALDHQCGACGEKSRYAIPFQLEDFYPTLSGDFEEYLLSLE